MPEDTKHYLEVGQEEMPGRGGLDEAAGDAGPAGDPMPAERPSKKPDMHSTRTASDAFDQCKSYVGIDYRGDRAPSDWLSVGERLRGLLWHIVLAIAIIAWFIYNLANCVARPNLHP